jgi:hypothetical protein
MRLWGGVDFYGCCAGSVAGLFPFETLEEVDYYFAYLGKVEFEDARGGIAG